jgi:hypothetical protein
MTGRNPTQGRRCTYQPQGRPCRSRTRERKPLAAHGSTACRYCTQTQCPSAHALFFCGTAAGPGHRVPPRDVGVADGGGGNRIVPRRWQPALVSVGTERWATSRSTGDPGADPLRPSTRSATRGRCSSFATSSSHETRTYSESRASPEKIAIAPHDGTASGGATPRAARTSPSGLSSSAE